MRKTFCIVSLMLLIFTLIPFCVTATENDTPKQDIIYFDDGSYIEIETTYLESRAISAQTGSRAYTYRDQDHKIQWQAVLQGTFSYDGTTSTCTASICTVSITDNAWYVVSKTTSKSGGTAYAELVIGRKMLGITVEKRTINLSLSCDKDGNLS